MISTAEFKKGVFIEMDKIPYQITYFQHVKPGKGNAFVRTKLKNLINGSVLERTFKSGEKVGVPDLEHKKMQFLYRDREEYQFMDMETFEQMAIDPAVIDENKYYLTENLEVEVLYFNAKPIALAVPNFVELVVEYTEPGGKGDTASGGGKPAQMNTGITVSVPFHISNGDRLKVDTRTAEYVEKLK